MSGGVNLEARAKWTFGSQARAEGDTTNNVNSTGTGFAYGINGLARENSFYIETDGNANSTCAYQIQTARTSSGPWVVLSSNTLSTGVVDLVQITGPLAFVRPRIKTLASTAGLVTVEYFGN